MNKVYIDKKEGYVEVAVTENGALEHFYRLDDDVVTGSVFLGKVENVIKELGVFVNIGRERNALLKYRDKLKVGDMVVVQVTREEEGEKGCAVTERITLAGRYAVLNDVGEYRFSRKITPQKAAELKAFRLEDAKTGLIFRSVCENAPVEAVKAEAEQLYSLYNSILKKAANNTKVQILHREKGIEVAKRFAESDEAVVYGFDEIAESLTIIGERKVEVEGVEIVFDKTEAMTVVDVNSHKFRHKYKDIDTANFYANIIAMREIARQIRIRNIGGIIMADFISMQDKALKDKLMTELEKELRKDNVMVKAELIESLSLIAIVRKKRYGDSSKKE